MSMCSKKSASAHNLSFFQIECLYLDGQHRKTSTYSHHLLHWMSSYEVEGVVGHHAAEAPEKFALLQVESICQTIIYCVCILVCNVVDTELLLASGLPWRVRVRPGQRPSRHLGLLGRNQAVLLPQVYGGAGPGHLQHQTGETSNQEVTLACSSF